MIGTVKDTSRRWILVAACVVTLLGIAVAIATLVTSRRPSAPPAAPASKPTLPAPPARLFLMFISLAPDGRRAAFTVFDEGTQRPQGAAPRPWR